MRRFPVAYPTRHKLNRIFRVSGSNEAGKIVGTIAPKKQGTENGSEGGSMKNSEKPTDPIVAFSRPPPFPPLIGPLVALSLLETWHSHDGDDN